MSAKKGSAKDITPVVKEVVKTNVILVSSDVLGTQAIYNLQEIYPNSLIMSIPGDVRSAIAIYESK